MQQKQFMWLLDLASLPEAVGVDGALAGDAAGRRPPLLPPPGYVGICIKICSILLHFPFKFKSGGFHLHMKSSVKEQAPYRPGLDGQRERELYSFTVCNQSLDYPCLDST
jgi:hypothetical protein